MMHPNKTSFREAELYSYRREGIRAVDVQDDDLLDLYGPGWNTDEGPDFFYSDSYVGSAPDNWETYSRYEFSLCIDNSREPGYVT